MGIVKFTMDSGECLTMITDVLQLIRREVDPVMPVQMVIVLLHILLLKEAQTKELISATGHSQAAMSRTISAFLAINRHGHKGYDLVTSRENPNERRAKIISLTQKGEELAEKLIDLLNDKL